VAKDEVDLGAGGRGSLHRRGQMRGSVGADVGWRVLGRENEPRVLRNVSYGMCYGIIVFVH